MNFLLIIVWFSQLKKVSNVLYYFLILLLLFVNLFLKFLSVYYAYAYFDCAVFYYLFSLILIFYFVIYRSKRCIQTNQIRILLHYILLSQLHFHYTVY